MDELSENPLHQIKPSKNINLSGLDKNIAHLISGYVAYQDLVNL
jgi:hypothetical protein